MACGSLVVLPCLVGAVGIQVLDSPREYTKHLQYHVAMSLAGISGLGCGIHGMGLTASPTIPPISQVFTRIARHTSPVLVLPMCAAAIYFAPAGTVLPGQYLVFGSVGQLACEWLMKYCSLVPKWYYKSIRSSLLVCLLAAGSSLVRENGWTPSEFDKLGVTTVRKSP